MQRLDEELDWPWNPDCEIGDPNCTMCRLAALRDAKAAPAAPAEPEKQPVNLRFLLGIEESELRHEDSRAEYSIISLSAHDSDPDDSLSAHVPPDLEYITDDEAVHIDGLSLSLQIDQAAGQRLHSLQEEPVFECTENEVDELVDHLQEQEFETVAELLEDIEDFDLSGVLEHMMDDFDWDKAKALRFSTKLQSVLDGVDAETTAIESELFRGLLCNTDDGNDDRLPNSNFELVVVGDLAAVRLSLSQRKVYPKSVLDELMRYCMEMNLTENAQLMDNIMRRFSGPGIIQNMTQKFGWDISQQINFRNAMRSVLDNAKDHETLLSPVHRRPRDSRKRF